MTCLYLSPSFLLSYYHLILLITFISGCALQRGRWAYRNLHWAGPRPDPFPKEGAGILFFLHKCTKCSIATTIGCVSPQLLIGQVDCLAIIAALRQDRMAMVQVNIRFLDSSISGITYPILRLRSLCLSLTLSLSPENNTPSHPGSMHLSMNSCILPAAASPSYRGAALWRNLCT